MLIRLESVDNIKAVLDAAGVTVNQTWIEYFACWIEKAEGVDKFMGAPGAGKNGRDLRRKWLIKNRRWWRRWRFWRRSRRCRRE